MASLNKAIAQQVKEHYENLLSSANFPFEKLIPSGSLLLFDRAPSRGSDFSLSLKKTSSPVQYEIDLNLTLAPGSNPHNFFLRRKLSKILNGTPGKRMNVFFRGVPQQVSLIHSYPERWPELEVEFHILCEPFVEITQFFPQVFSQEEIDLQLLLRRKLLEFGEATEYRALKGYFYLECERRVRLCLLYPSADVPAPSCAEGSGALEVFAREDSLIDLHPQILPLEGATMRRLSGELGAQWKSYQGRPAWLDGLEHQALAI